MRTTILVGVMACLCFSVGEGLRLRPFPVSTLVQLETTNTKLNDAETLNDTSLSKYGPLDVPTRAQKRGKRQVVDFGNLPSQSNRELMAHQVPLSETGQAVDIVSLLFVSRSSGRAPPFIS